MSLDISYYRKINNCYNSEKKVSKKESEIYELKSHIMKTFNQSLDFHDDTLRNNIKQNFLITYHKSKNKKNISAYPDDKLYLGDKISCFDAIWLDIYIDIDKTIYTKGVIQQCNYTLPFQTITSTILNEPCIVVQNKFAGTGEKEDKIITLPDSERVVYIQYNGNTKYLTEEKRIFIDQLTDKPKVYKITKVDRINFIDGEHGLLELTCVESLFEPDKDNKELKIADYIDDIKSVPSTENGRSLITNTHGSIYTDLVKLKAGGNKKPFVCKFEDSIGKVIHKKPVWSLIVDDSVIDKVHLTYNGLYPDRCYINIENDMSLIGKTFGLSLKDSESLFSEYKIKIMVVSIFG